jgi:muconolactone delta-isomerase
MAERVPSPADEPELTARQLLRRIRRKGGRVYRMREYGVFVLTDSPDLASWLMKLGARAYSPQNATPMPNVPLGSYRRAPGGKIEWDLYIHAIPVAGEQTVWEAAGEAEVEVVDAEEVG